jgi:hypothetical protein
MNEAELRAKFDFSKATRGRYFERYQRGSAVTLLDHDPDEERAAPAKVDSQLTELAGKHMLISQLVAAGYEIAEPLRDKGIDLVAYREGKGAEDFWAYPIQIKASSHESFSLDVKYERFPRLLIAYIWNVHGPERSEVYALTFKDARHVMEEKGYLKTDSWTKRGYYFVRDAGNELKTMLEPYRMTPERWQERLQTL